MYRIPEEVPRSELQSTWDAQRTSGLNGYGQSSQSLALIPVRPENNARVHPQYGIADEQQLQMYQQPMYQSQASQINQTNINTNKQSSSCGSCKDLITPKLIVGLLIGGIICGVPMVVMTVLYVQAQSSNNSSTGSNGSATTSAGLPSQCSTTSALSDAQRVYTWSTCCYASDCSLTAAWYRITGSAGTRLVTNPVSTGYCGTSYPVWFNGSLPTTSGSTVSGVVCANVGGTICPAAYSTTISVTNCGSYYVFYLPSLPQCSTRYCTI